MARLKTSEVWRKARKARLAARAAARLDSQTKNKILLSMADYLEQGLAVVLKANAQDVMAARPRLPASLLDRLILNERRVKVMADGLRAVAKLPDPNKRLVERIKRPNRLRIEKITVPLGVIALIYEARPNVTADAAGLCLKAGSAVILRGGSDAARSNQVIVRILRKALRANNAPEDIVQSIETTSRRAVTELLNLRGYVDLLIPRGGAGLIQKVVAESSLPVLETGTGNCHVYVDEYADVRKAVRITVNAKCQRPSVCNAAESLLVHQKIAARFFGALKMDEVLFYACPRARRYLPQARPAREADYAREYLDLAMSVKIVDSLDEAIEHIYRYGTKHTETIVTENKQNAEKFLREIDAAAVMVNASTRFTDGGEFGFGCEIGISTQKLHARGPLGLRELMSYKYLVRGQGQVRA
ncbi:gamma-glutamyl phosphate reductase [Candidatus Termititenax persephonae]|uniref:Gamma-glutamyl phosphate reductase n=1 Tax=Candidatus Termititenax persephonae TaxID=2218525 RepID=A0A388TFA3_9BACT|nr:gamma-glutamyl phosphate reductase [Candidatus Termititenax persephonae]